MTHYNATQHWVISGSDIARPVIFFDCDGTLADTHEMIVAATSDAIHSQNLDVPSVEAIRAVIGIPLAPALAKLTNIGLADDRLSAMVKRFLAYDQQNTPHSAHPIFPGVIELLHKLYETGLPLAVATGRDAKSLQGFLDHHGISKLFQQLKHANNSLHKPDPEMLLTSLDELEGDLKKSVMIGDSALDIEMAKQAGILALGVDWNGTCTTTLNRAGADQIATNAEEIWAFINETIIKGTI